MIYFQAHDLISEMEAAKEDVLLEIKTHKLPGSDSDICRKYFKDFDSIKEKFENELGR